MLCGIEEIGVQCEEPFGILPLEVICKRISTDVNSTIENDQEIRKMIRSSIRADIAPVRETVSASRYPSFD